MENFLNYLLLITNYSISELCTLGLLGARQEGSPIRIKIQFHQHHSIIMLIAHSAFSIQQS